MTYERKAGNFIDAYMEYTDNTESATVFHKWVCFSTISSALRRKCVFNLGRITVYPNMYVVLVAGPGTARKSAAISFGTKILNGIDNIHVTADAITREALIQELEASKSVVVSADKLTTTVQEEHSSLSIISPEFESFLGQKSDNQRMLSLLTDLFDCSDKWTYTTKMSGENTIVNLFVNLLGATTPDSLSTSFPASAIGGGLSSRIMFIWADSKAKRVPIPVWSPRVLELKDALIEDLRHISMLNGIFLFDNDSKEWWKHWYRTRLVEVGPERICQDPSFDGWYSRKSVHVLKLASVLSAAESDDMVITINHLEESVATVEEVEQSMGNAFRSVGKSQTSAETDRILTVIRQCKSIRQQDLMKQFWRDLDKKQFDTVIETLMSTGRVKKVLDNENNPMFNYTGG